MGTRRPGADGPGDAGGTARYWGNARRRVLRGARSRSGRPTPRLPGRPPGPHLAAPWRAGRAASHRAAQEVGGGAGEGPRAGALRGRPAGARNLEADRPHLGRCTGLPSACGPGEPGRAPGGEAAGEGPQRGRELGFPFLPSLPLQAPPRGLRTFWAPFPGRCGPGLAAPRAPTGPQGSVPPPPGAPSPQRGTQLQREPRLDSALTLRKLQDLEKGSEGDEMAPPTTRNPPPNLLWPQELTPPRVRPLPEPAANAPQALGAGRGVLPRRRSIPLLLRHPSRYCSDTRRSSCIWEPRGLFEVWGGHQPSVQCGGILCL